MSRGENDYVRARREGRERALELAYEARIRGLDVDALLATLPLAPQEFAETLLRLAEKHQDEADRLISSKARGWTMERMPAMDVVILRLAVAELLEGTAPAPAVLAEAVGLASRYSTDESGRFVNGVLAAVARDLESSS